MRISYATALRRHRLRQGLRVDETPPAPCAIAARSSLELQELAKGLFLVLPFLLLTSIAPSVTVRAMLNFTFCWVVPCKLLLLFYTNFLLDNPSAWTLSEFSHFLLAFLLPVRMKGIIKPGPNYQFLVSNHLFPLLIRLCILLCYLSFYDTNMPFPLPHISHCIVLYLILDLPHRIASIALLAIFSIETHPTFHSPWLSSSPTDFWGHRWDLTANALLRHTIYNPIINMLTMPSLQVAIKDAIKLDATSTENDCKLLCKAAVSPPPLEYKTSLFNSLYRGISGHEAQHKLENDIFMSNKIKSLEWKMEASTLSARAKMMCAPTKPPSLAARLVGVNATFFVSGLIHEALYFCVTQGEVPTWEVTAFFVMQGMAASMEILMRRSADQYSALCKRMPRPLKVGLTMAFMYASATWLFFPQLVRAGVYMKCVQEHEAMTHAVKTLIARTL
ncbi:hypothetical protein L7F22_054576 [Adiantum nelumboides]|nr:hypothetical protein [Adiantum nelumboides]